MIYLALFCLIVLAAASHAVMDAISHKRIHLARHPLRDAWHCAQHIRVAALILTGYALRPAFADPWAASLTIACGLVIGRYVWVVTYAEPEYWLRIDETLKIRTGWKWLDRILGLHW